MAFLSLFIQAFIPLLVAMDAIGVLPFFVTITEGLSPVARKRVLLQAVLTAGLAGISFILIGKAIFNFLGITVADFKVAGGLILLILAVTDLLFAQKVSIKSAEDVGIVPLGMPLIVGPAVLTALIMQVDQVGVLPTLTAFAANLLLSLALFSTAGYTLRHLGTGGAQAISKVANLLLAAIGVMMIRVGLKELLAG